MCWKYVVIFVFILLSFSLVLMVVILVSNMFVMFVVFCLNFCNVVCVNVLVVESICWCIKWCFFIVNINWFCIFVNLVDKCFILSCLLIVVVDSLYVVFLVWVWCCVGVSEGRFICILIDKKLVWLWFILLWCW